MSIRAEEIKKSRFVKTSNITIVVDGATFCINKDELVNISPVFKIMLNSDFLEKEQLEIKLPGKERNSFTLFLQCLSSPGIAEGITVENVHQVLPLAHEYQTDILLQEIDCLLALNSKTNEHNLLMCDVIDNIVEAELYNLERYLQINIDIASRRQYINLVQEPGFQQMSQKTKLKISEKFWGHKDSVYSKTHAIHRNIIIKSATS